MKKGVQTEKEIAKKNIIVQNFDSTSSEVYVVLATNIGNNSGTIRAALQWREIY